MRKLIGLVLVVLLGSFFVPAAGLTRQAKCKVVNQTTGGRFDNLQAAVDNAASGDTLRVKGTCHGTTTLLGGINLTIKGKSNPGLGEATLDGDNAGSVLTISAAIVEINGLRITNGNASVGGGINNDSGVVTLIDSTVSGNTAEFGGGGIFNVSGEFFGVVTLIDSTVSSNTAAGIGGGILSDGFGLVELIHSTVSSNTASFGGGIFNAGGEFFGELRLTDSTVSDNIATEDGGGIFNDDGGTLELINSTVSGNSPNDCTGCSDI